MLKYRKGVVLMAKKKLEPDEINFNELKPDEKLKYEIAEELGLMDKVLKDGWKSLSAKDTGRIGGIMTKRKKEMKKEESKQEL
jgi:hypothetical protein